MDHNNEQINFPNFFWLSKQFENYNDAFSYSGEISWFCQIFQRHLIVFISGIKVRLRCHMTTEFHVTRSRCRRGQFQSFISIEEGWGTGPCLPFTLATWPSVVMWHLCPLQCHWWKWKIFCFSILERH